MRLEVSFEETRRYADDTRWIEENASSIATQLELGIKDEQRQGEAIDVLLAIFPQLFQSAHIRRWSRLADLAVRYAIEAPVVNYPDTNQPEYLIGNRYFLKRLDHGIGVRRPEPGRKVRVRINPRRFFEQYLLLALTQYFRGMLHFNEHHVNDVLAMARLVNHPELHSKAYQVAALIFCSLDLFSQSQHFAQLSLTYYEKQRNMLESAISAQLLAASSQKQGRHDKAELYHNKARTYIAQTHYPDILDTLLF